MVLNDEDWTVWKRSLEQGLRCINEFTRQLDVTAKNVDLVANKSDAVFGKLHSRHDRRLILELGAEVSDLGAKLGVLMETARALGVAFRDMAEPARRCASGIESNSL